MSKLYIMFKSWWIGDKVSAEGFSFNWQAALILIIIVIAISFIFAWFSEKKAKVRREKWKKIIKKNKK
jgi:ABC-type transport system involved in cytochrome bd biosynthesis fused ATPase/permease subunit